MQVLQGDLWSYHFWKGLRCGYPICCILWFCNVVTNYGEQRDSLFERIFREVYDDKPLTRKQADFNKRNMCPDCISNTLNKITLQNNSVD